MKKTIVLLLIFLCTAGFFPAGAFTETGDGLYVPYRETEIYTRVYNFNPRANEAIIFLHGLGGGHEHAEFLFHPDNRSMTITFDFLNHGQSGKIDQITWDDLLGSVEAVVEAYGIKKVNLVGHSFGADMAMMFAAAYPNRVKDIVLIDRAYYNYSDMEDFNFTRLLVEILEFNPESGLTPAEFSQYLDLAYDNDISRTWDLKKKALLIGADPSMYLEMPGFIAALKANPEAFGLPPEMAALLPEISGEDAQALCNYLLESAAGFATANHSFDVLHTPYPHTMNLLPEIEDDVRGYVLGYLKNRLSKLR